MSKNECINLINSNDIIDDLFALKVFLDGIICFRIYADLKNNNLIKMLLIMRLN